MLPPEHLRYATRCSMMCLLCLRAFSDFGHWPWHDETRMNVCAQCELVMPTASDGRVSAAQRRRQPTVYSSREDSINELPIAHFCDPTGSDLCLPYGVIQRRSNAIDGLLVVWSSPSIVQGKAMATSPRRTTWSKVLHNDNLVCQQEPAAVDFDSHGMVLVCGVRSDEQNPFLPLHDAPSIPPWHLPCDDTQTLARA